MRALGRLVPTDWEHVRKFPLSALPSPPTGVPVAIGINWYTDFDSPQEDGSRRWWVARDGIKGSIRGGHCVCIKADETDAHSWLTFYNQGREGACVGFGCSRMMSLLNRVRYDARWLWQQARLIDEWTDNDDLSDGDQGTSVRAGLEILRTVGHKRAGIHAGSAPRSDDGIAAYRWALSADEVITTIDMPLAKRLGAVPFLNSWGRDYPHITWMPGEVLNRLLHEDGEVAIVTDR